MADVDLTPDPLESWPETMRRLAAIIGPEQTIALAARCGGLDAVYIPHVETGSHIWTTVLSAEEWTKVVAAMGGERIDLPRGVFVRLRKREILTLAEQGVAHRHIALRVGTTERYVRRVLEGLRIGKPEDERQGKLFR